MCRLPLLVILLLTNTISLSADDFTRFRGADATGVADDHPALPTRWSKTENVAWVADVPRQGWGSPIIVGDRVFVTSVVADEENLQPQSGLYMGLGVRDPAKGIHHWMVFCFNLNTGQQLWKQEARNDFPSFPRSGRRYNLNRILGSMTVLQRGNAVSDLLS